MNIKQQFSNQRYFQFTAVFGVLVFVMALTACSSSIPKDDPTAELQPVDEMMSGPGVFSGEKGAFYIVGGDKKVEKETVARPVSSTKSVSNMDLNETSKVLDEKIRQLERDQMELELLKREIDKKLKQ